MRLDGSAIIDLLAVDKKTDELVGFELKVADGGARLFDQAARCMTCLARQAKKEGRSGARFVVITGEPDAELAGRVHELGAHYGVKTECLLYK